MDILNNLNPQQRQAVTAGLGQILVLAGPGSGKTRVLTRRVAYLIGSMGVQPYHILAVTFTNKAAREMGERVGSLVGENNHDIWLGTFHGTCARILRREANYLPVTSSYVIFDADDQETLVKRAVRELNLDEKLYRPAKLHAAISQAKNDMILADDYPSGSYREEVTRRVYKRYEELLRASNAFDFDDLLLWSVRLMEENPTVRERYAHRFEHVLVDEFQDTNTAQYRLLSHLSSFHKNIFVVGDEDQSIYRWRGADYRNVLRFEKEYPECQKILLEQNYRSTQTVLNAARAVIDHNPNRTPKHLFSDRGDGEAIELHEAGDDREEAAFVVKTIQEEMRDRKAHGGDFAVMYRTNAQSRVLEEAFLHAGQPYRLVGAQRFYGRREVKDVIAYLRLVQNPSDEVSLTRVINVPLRGIGDKKIEDLRNVANQASQSMGNVLLDLGQKGDQSVYWPEFTGRGVNLLADFGSRIADWRKFAAEESLPNLFDRILENIGYQDYIDDNSDEGTDRWENVQELSRLAYEYQDRGLTAFLENLALVSDQDTVPEKLDSPTLLTLHAAKGLEFSQVFIIGLDEGLLPHSRSLDDPEEMAEERRLFYVGMTRAKDRLYLVRADQRSNYGSFESSVASRFIDDIPGNLLQSKGKKSRSHRSGLGTGRSSSGGYSERQERATRWDAPAQPSQGKKSSSNWSASTRTAPTPPPPAPAPIVEQKYSPTQRVRHPSWGEGIVLESRLQDGDEVVTVQFESVGLKRLLASLAKLEIVSG